MSRVSGAMVSDARPHLPTEGAANSGCLFASRATTQMRAIAPKPEGTGLSGRSALSRRSPVGPATGVASLRASLAGKHDRRLRPLNALDASDRIEVVVDLLGAAAFDSDLVVEHTR